MLSAPKEEYQIHIENSLSQWDKISSRFLPSLTRLFEENNNIMSEIDINQGIRRMIFSHDVGKLTKRWQKIMSDIADGGKAIPRPPHSALGAAYLLEWNKAREQNNNLGKASIFAVLIHHIDSSISNESLESPEAQTIQKLFIQGGDDIPWHTNGDSALRSIKFNESIIELQSVTLNSLIELSDTLRGWAKCPRALDQHKHRLLGSSLHHILKICDWRAATERPVDEKEKEVHYSVLEVLNTGGIIS